MISPTYGKCSDEEMIHIIANYIWSHNETSQGFRLIFGTDSQNFSDTKIVVVVAVQNIGHGGIFFYDVLRINRIDNIRQKLLYETNMSLTYADRVLSKFENLCDKMSLDLSKINICIHIDAGCNGQTSTLIPELVAWVKACGYDCKVKPDSFAASSIADKFSK
jgi:predicted RNase H-related nuclease YkuK (DUF458 family)